MAVGATPLERASALVERGTELARLDAVLALARSGNGAAVVIEGPAGIGKTSLLTYARAHARDAEMTVLHARGTPLEQDFAMGVIRQALEPSMRAETDPEQLFAGAAGLARAVVLDPGEGAGAAPIGVLHGLYWLLANLAARAPVLVAIDDAHWADEASLRCLAYLVRRAESLPVAILVAARSGGTGPVHELLAELRADPATEVLRPRPLARPGVGEVLRSAGQGAVAEEFVAACHEATGGNPFLVDELVRELRSEGIEFSAAAATRIGGFAPPTVARRVQSSLERLGPQARALAHAVAVLGDGVELDLAADFAGIPAGTATGLAERLVQAGVLADATPLRFLHPILAGAVGSEMTAPRLAAEHARAVALLRARGAPPERIVLQLMHAEPAGDVRAVAELREVAAGAWRRGAPGTAAVLLRRALAEPPPAAEQAASVLELGLAEYAIGRTAEAAAHLQRAYERAADPRSRARALVGLFQARAGEFSAQRALAPLFEQALPEVLAADRELGLRIWTLWLLASDPGPQWAQAMAGAEQLTGATPGEALVLGHLALPIMTRGQTGAQVGETIERLARHADALLAEGATALVVTGFVLGLCWSERLDQAERILDRAIAVARERGATGDYALAHQYRSWTVCRAGRLLDAEADARTALEAAGGAGWAAAGAGALIPLLGALLTQGRIEEAARELEARHPSATVADSPGLTPLLAERMRLRAAQGRHADAVADWALTRERVERHLGAINPSSIPDLLSAAESYHALGETERRDALLEEAGELAREWGTPGFLGAVRHRTARLVGGAGAVAEMGEAISALRRSPDRLELARALVSQGEALRRQGQRERAREPLSEGHELARLCGAAGLAERARAELRASGLRVRREGLTGVESLTASEQRISQLAARGASNAEIAQTLFLTVKTVEMHLTNAYRKLGVAGRAELGGALGANS